MNPRFTFAVLSLGIMLGSLITSTTIDEDIISAPMYLPQSKVVWKRYNDRIVNGKTLSNDSLLFFIGVISLKSTNLK